MNKQQKRLENINNYNANPNKCILCNSVIPLNPNYGVHVTRVKKFCNRSCAITYNNRLYPKRTTTRKAPETKIYFDDITKQELFDRAITYHSARSSIRKHAEKIFNKNNALRECVICGYKTHIEICHIQSVSSFSGNTLISEINHINNLIALCPNHHWEYDNGLVTDIGIEPIKPEL